MTDFATSPAATATAQKTVPPFAVIPGAQVQQVLQGREKQVVELIEQTYRTHAAGDSVNPPSYFLRFPDRPTSRIIALPASIGGDIEVDGIKWVSSFPDNVASGIPRASAVLILNDKLTGYPFACMEGSIISASRTAASAAAAAHWLTRHRARPRRIGFFGVGLIARYIHTYLTATDWTFDQIGVFDLSADSAQGFKGYLERSSTPAPVTVHEGPEQLIRNSDLVVFATIAGEPHVHDTTWFAHNPLVLHISLRDLAPEILQASTNILDDVDHCLKAGTSAHLLEQKTGTRDFVDGTLADIMEGKTTLPDDRPTVFSPFGLGILDLAVGKYVYDELAHTSQLQVHNDFFSELHRYGS